LTPSGSADISRLLKAWRAGDQTALDRLTPLVYDELRRMARRYMRKERGANTLQTTALVHEAYLRLVDAARARASAKRGGGVEQVAHSEAVNLDEMAESVSQKSVELLALDEALQDLAGVDPRKARVIELRFFGGLSVEETAEVLNISPQSVMRDWKLARAWLNRELRSRP